MPNENIQVLQLRLAYHMLPLLLSLLFIPLFTSTALANDRLGAPNDRFKANGDMDRDVGVETLCSKNSADCNQNSIKQRQKRKRGWGQNPTSIQRKSGGLQLKSRS